MNEEDKATTIIPQSPSEGLIEKVDRRDRLVRIMEVGLLFALTLFNVAAVVQTQQIISRNERNTQEARQANIDRQVQMTAYIKCIILIRYDTPAADLTNREGTEAALDKCATSSKK